MVGITPQRASAGPNTSFRSFAQYAMDRDGNQRSRARYLRRMERVVFSDAAIAHCATAVYLTDVFDSNFILYLGVLSRMMMNSGC